MNGCFTEWKKIQLGLLGDFSKGSGITKKDLVQEGLPCVRYAELYTKFDFIIPFCISFISEEIAKTAKPIQKGDILFAGSGETKEEIGKCAVYMNNLNAYAGGDNIIFRTTKAEPLYLSFYLNTLGRKQLNKIGQGDSIVHIHSADLKRVIIPLPPLPEQEKIAEILGTWDTAIEKLSALIEQKKQLKKGLMQRLLTGKQRLSGFSAPWKRVKLGDVFLKSLHKNKEAKNLPVLTNSATQGIILQEDYFDREIVTKENLCNYYCIENGDFIYNPRISKSAPAGPIRINHFREKGCISPLYTVFKIKTGNYPFFYEIYFESNLWIYEAYKVANYGARSDRMNITDEDFFNMKIPSPPLPEQKAIADILSKADEEIDLLTAKLSALKTQKTGLMQQLLTGKIRVKVA